MTELLHITNGSAAVSRIHPLGLSGDIVPWDDVLHEGPVPERLDRVALRRVRAAFLARTWTGAVREVEQMLEQRDRVFDAGVAEVVLWFEHDLYDQLHVLQILDGFAEERRAGRPLPKVTAILADDYLTAQSDDTLRRWFEARRELTADEWAAAGAAWSAFRSSDPSALNGFAHPGAWPSLRGAMQRHLRQFPGVETGLSRSESQAVAALAAGPRPLRDLFVAANHQAEPAVFMGDSTWWWHLRPLLDAARPLLRADGDAPVSYAHPDWWRADDPPRVALTAVGERVAAGELDHVALNGIDRWLGGVHLHRMPGDTQPTWRWDEHRGVLRRL